MSFFTDKLQPNDLKPKEFVEFVLHVMKDYYVDMSQPYGWTRIANPDGSGIPYIWLGRNLTERVNELGTALTPGLLSKMIRTFLINGPAISPELSNKAREQQNLAQYQPDGMGGLELIPTTENK